MIPLKPQQLLNSIQYYNWGTRGKNALIPHLLNIPAEKDKPYAELWMGVHPNAPSCVVANDSPITLEEYISTDPAGILGAGAASRFNTILPFLLKVLSVGEALSVQTHPNKEQAEKLHRSDPEHYPDDNHKPEIAIAIDDLWALIGFRSVEEIKINLKTYPEMGQFIGADMVESFIVENDDKRAFELLKSIYKTMMSRSVDAVDALEKSLAGLMNRLMDLSELKKEEQLYLQLRQKYGTDVGLFNLFFLKLIRLTTGQAVYMPAGVPHAYLEGNIVECMANSDNVVRAGLTPKFKDVKMLLEIIRFNREPLPVFEPLSHEKVYTYQTPAEEFSISRILLNKGERHHPQNIDSSKMCLIIDGAIHVKYEGLTGTESEVYRKGNSFIIPAKLNLNSFNASAKSTLFMVTIPS